MKAADMNYWEDDEVYDDAYGPKNPRPRRFGYGTL